MFELIVELVLEFLGEVIVQVLFEALAEVGLHLFRKPAPGAPAIAAWKAGLGYAVLGAALGGLSLLVFPGSFMHTAAGRVVALLLAPVASGLAMAVIGAWRQRRGQGVLRLDRFAYGYLFALGMAVVRFGWAR